MSTTYAQKQAPAQKKESPTAASILDTSSQSESLQRKADMANNVTTKFSHAYHNYIIQRSKCKGVLRNKFSPHRKSSRIEVNHFGKRSSKYAPFHPSTPYKNRKFAPKFINKSDPCSLNFKKNHLCSNIQNAISISKNRFFSSNINRNHVILLSESSISNLKNESIKNKAGFNTKGPLYKSIHSYGIYECVSDKNRTQSHFINKKFIFGTSTFRNRVQIHHFEGTC